MKNRIRAPQKRAVRTLDPLQIGYGEPDDRILSCLLSLICGAAPSTTPSATGGAIRFRAGSSRLDAHARTALRRWSAGLRVDPGMRVLIGGFTSQLQFTPGAMGLALRRIDVIREYLRSRGIGADRIEVAVCGAGWFLVERLRGVANEDLSGRCTLEIVDPQWALSRN